MAKLKPAFVRPHGTITAANASFLVSEITLERREGGRDGRRMKEGVKEKNGERGEGREERERSDGKREGGLWCEEAHHLDG